MSDAIAAVEGRRASQATLPDRFVATTTVALVAVPVVGDLAASSFGRTFGYVAADSFYYLEVARNWARCCSSSPPIGGRSAG